mmetsp:Transcript_43752/g.106095  ORF Transcript_43752/g.106095 Transcript_43752/m.106095 type:complete len:523 (+) Transcript_43752:59-1627(+)
MPSSSSSSHISNINRRFHVTIIQRFVVVTFVCYVSMFKSTFPLLKNNGMMMMIMTTTASDEDNGGGTGGGERKKKVISVVETDREQLLDELSLRSSVNRRSQDSQKQELQRQVQIRGQKQKQIRGNSSTPMLRSPPSSSIVQKSPNTTMKIDRSKPIVTVLPPLPTEESLIVDPSLPNISDPNYFKDQKWRTLLPQWTKERLEQKGENKKRIQHKVRTDNSTSPKILVVYSGPTDLPIDPDILSKGSTLKNHKNELYRVNFEHFLQYGVQCRTQDTVVVVTEVVEPIYKKQIDSMNDQCQNDFGTKVMMVVRNSTCYDLESVRRVLHDGIFTEQELLSYDYFVYANCGTSGPSKVWAELPWTDIFIEPMKLNPKVKMTGLTMNCPSGFPRGHIQSMMYATDRTGLSLIRRKKNGVIYRCNEHKDGVKSVILKYELGLSRLLMQYGYAISPIIAPTVVYSDNQTLCQHKDRKYFHDIWTTKTTTKVFNRTLDLDETIFSKTSRIMSDATREQIGYKYRMNWSW